MRIRLSCLVLALLQATTALAQTNAAVRARVAQERAPLLDTLKDLSGEYRTVPHTFNAETYENDRFSADVLALGGIEDRLAGRGSGIRERGGDRRE